MNRKLKYWVFVLLLSIPGSLYAQDEFIDRENMQFIYYPDFPDGNSTWGDIGYSPKSNSVWVGVTNHRNKIGLYEYKSDSLKITRKGWVADMAFLRPYQWQGKVHTKICTDQNGDIYFGTDGGESREEFIMNNPKGYFGGFLLKYSPGTGTMTNFGMIMPWESIKDIDIDPWSGMLYAITYPQVHFIVFDPSTNKVQDLGRLGSAHVPRVMFTDRWGNAYYVDWRQRLVKYEKSEGKLIFAPESLPAFEGTPGYKIITGITAFAKDTVNNVIYLLTYGAKILAFYPREHGIGKVDDLGSAYDNTDPLWGPYVPNLNMGNNGKLYYFAGGHGNFIQKDKTLFIEMNPKTGERKILFAFPTSELSEATGSGVKDKDGNLYFAARKMVPKSEVMKPNQHGLDEGDAVSVPFLVKFNPEKK